MPDILSGVTQPNHLMGGCLIEVARRSAQGHEGVLERCGSNSISDAKTAVHQNKPVFCLDEQAMHGQVSIGRQGRRVAENKCEGSQRSAIEVMDTHVGSCVRRTRESYLYVHSISRKQCARAVHSG